MAHIYRLVLASLLLLLSGHASAFTGGGWDDSYCNQENFPVGVLLPGTSASWSCKPSSNPDFQDCGYTYNNGWYEGKCTQSRTNACPSNSTGTSPNCQCNTGYFERTVDGSTQCVKPDDRTPEQLCEDLGMLWNSTLNNDRFVRIGGKTLSETHMGITTCFDPGPNSGMPSGKGCKHKFTGDLGFIDAQGNKWVNGFSFAYDSTDKAQAGGSLACNLADPEPTKETQPKDCRDGYKGSVNGVEVCIEAVTGDTEGIDWTRSTDGEGNQTDEKTRVKCNGDKCTVTTDKTTTKPDGTTTTTTTTTEDVNRQGYCARNPESSVCGRSEDDDGANKGARERGGGGSSGGDGDGDGEGEQNPSQFGGACAAGFTCEGDAILCAIAKDQHERACDLFDDETSAEYLLYQSEKEKTGKVTEDLEGNRTVDVAGIVSASDVFLGGAASCPADPTITLHNGMTFVIPYSTLCPYLVTLGNILVIISSMSAVLILIRRI